LYPKYEKVIDFVFGGMTNTKLPSKSVCAPTGVPVIVY